MMPDATTPKPCSLHSRMVRELALGATDGAETEQAERAVEECGTCREWWQALQTFPAVARGVEDGLAGFRAPDARRESGRRWQARLAAGVAALVGAGAIWMALDRETRQEASTSAPGPAAPTAGEVVFADGLESGDLSAYQVQARSREVVFADGLESGDLGAWRPQS